MHHVCVVGVTSNLLVEMTGEILQGMTIYYVYFEAKETHASVYNTVYIVDVVQTPFYEILEAVYLYRC